MKYKKMSEMSQYEIHIAFSLLIPNGTIEEFKKSDNGDFIEINFKLPYDNMSHSIVLLPDYAVEIPDIITIDGNHLWDYQKFMVARGYSELWFNNPFLH